MKREAIPSLLVKVERMLKRHAPGSAGLVAAVSGGSDSVALLRAVRALRPTLSIVVAHLNHQLRGTESDADENFVRRLVDSHQQAGDAFLSLRCARVPVADLAREEGGNLEDVARRLRYAWLTRVAQDSDARIVATGHIADDQAETVLHRLLRGTGLKGLRGIASHRPLAPGIDLVRPLLETTRAEVLAYLDEVKQTYCQDRSNLDQSFTRNRIRHKLLPLLKDHYNPAVVAVLCRLAEQAQAAFHDTEEQCRRLLAEAERPRASQVLVFDHATLLSAPRDRVREMFRLVWEREGWPQGAMGFAAWERLAAVAHGEADAVDLPGGIHVRRRARVVQVGRTL